MIKHIYTSALDFIEGQLSPDLLDTIDDLSRNLGGRKSDDFGYTPEQLKWVLPVAGFFYRRWFRTESVGLEQVPPGRVLLVSNHSGQIPIDAAMIAAALMLDAQQPRAVRSMVERWVPSLPYASVFFARLGQVLGTPENCRRLLEQAAPVLVFPEGARGISKPYKNAYQLQEFGHGFMRLALETGTPIVPVGVVGAEEQYLNIGNMDRAAKTLGIPAFPLIVNLLVPVLGWLPLPVKYRIYFGRPLYFEGDPEEDDIEIGKKVAVVKAAIDGLLKRGLSERDGYFL
ncbi:MAG: glycerol acyltransferase [Myxococcales bacterium]|nr:glycerol acyltransferase [Myxococcales bacterium]|tara:strand:- start:1339 stop:2196 length:858 start_codon:yes stop_codon:yes gene_type:complete